MNYHSRKTYAIINLNALVANYKTIASLAPQSNTIAVIKANAYGHGTIEIAKNLSQLVSVFAVAFIDEAMALRNAGITLPILILEGALSKQDFDIAAKHRFYMMIHNHQQIDWLVKQTPSFTGNLWLKVDTGMNRLGCRPSEVPDFLDKLTETQYQNLVLCTHFSNAEEVENPKTLQQIAEFTQITQKHALKTSLANSAGILNWPESHSDFNRLGIALYGTSPLSSKSSPIALQPVMTLQANIIGLRTLALGQSVGYGETWQAKRKTIIATVAIGYGDGYPRNAKAGTPVFIHGQTAPIAGRVSMDMITVDVTDINNVRLGDCVELWGDNLSIDTVAEYMDTINYELLTRISARVTRKYIS